MNVFICGSTYTVKTLLSNFEYCIPSQIDSILVLAENHSNYEFEHSFPFTVRCLPNVSDCVKNSDLSLIFKQSTIPRRSIDKIELLCKDFSKEHAVIDDPWVFTDEGFKHKELYNKSNAPIIDIVHSGIHSQPFIVELMLNKIFVSEHIKFSQSFTESTHNLLCQFKARGILNDKIVYLLEDYTSEPDIMICAFDIGEKLQYLEDYIEYRKHEKPDFIFFQTTLDYVEYVKNNVNQILYYSLERKIDCLNASLYHSILQNHGNYVYCEDETFSSKIMYSTFNNLTAYTIKSMIFEKIALPSGIIPM